MAHSSSPDIVQADLGRNDHRADVLALTAAYARDPMGKGSALVQEALDRLIDGLKRHPTTLIFLAYLQGQAAGIATCFLGPAAVSRPRPGAAPAARGGGEGARARLL